MFDKTKKLYSFALLLLFVTIGINAFVMWKRQVVSYGYFPNPISTGTKVDLSFLQEGKEKVILFVKPKCPSCLGSKKIINELYKKFNSQVDFLGFYPIGFENREKELELDFETNTCSPEVFNALQLNFTPQVVVVERGVVTFRFDRKEGNYEQLFKNLESYLTKKYQLK
jgi:thiol-disulfide isomerase/thioredoxin